MSKTQRPITFTAPADLKARIDGEVVRRTVERKRAVTTSEVIRDALERGLSFAGGPIGSKDGAE
jgi:hypothetical protein